MKFQKPYIIETDHYIQIYFGGACNPSKLQTQKRKKITKYTRQSQKRLLEKIDTVIGYKPNYIMRLYFNFDVPIKKSIFVLISFFVSTESYYKGVIQKIPMVFWRKCFSNNQFWYECLLDLPENVNIKRIDFMCNLYWKLKVGKLGKVTLEHFNECDRNDVINKFCFENYKGHENEDIGRYWGMIYKKYHKFKKVNKKEYSSLAIKEKVKNLKPIKIGNVKRYIFEKPNESSK